MTDVLALLLPPLFVSVCLVGIHAFLGIQVLARQVIFVDLALAQIAALGATIAFMLGHPAQSVTAYAYSLMCTLAAAALLASSRKWSERVPQEAWVGIIYVVAAAAAILLIDRAPQGAEHLKQVLTGNILTSGTDELAIIVPVYTAIGLLHWVFRTRLTGPGSLLWDFVFYASFGVVVTSSVAIAGVLLVFSFLIIPAAIGVMFSDRFAAQLGIGWTTGTLASVAGLAASFALDLPTGAAMVCTFGAVLVIAGLWRWIARRSWRSATSHIVTAARWTAAALLTVSALGFAIAPRADQPLLDALEAAIPSVRTLYFTKAEQLTYTDAALYADRYFVEAERLNAMEKQSRASDALDDTAVAKLSSYLKSYGEMRKGEQFVMQEVRAHARERVRWLLSPALLLLAALCVPVRLPALVRRALGRAISLPRARPATPGSDNSGSRA